METYRLSSKLRDQEREYLIQTANDTTVGAIATTVYIDGELAETLHRPHPPESSADDVLSLVRATHNEWKTDVESLVATYRRVLEDGDPQIMSQCAHVLLYRGFYRETRELLLAAVREVQDFHQAYNALCLCESALGNIDAAVNAGKRAVQLRPEFADYRNNLGEAYLACGESERAIEHFDAAIGINLYYADAYFNRGLAVLLQAGTAGVDANAAISKVGDNFRKAALILPELGGSTFDTGMAALKEHDISRAMQIFKSIRSARRERKRLELANVHARVPLHPDQMSERAVVERTAALKAEVARNPLYPDLHSELARCYLEQARLACQKAVDHLKKAETLNPSLSHNHDAYDQADEILQRLNSAAGRMSERG